MNILKKAVPTITAVSLSYLRRQYVAVGYYNVMNFGDLLTPDIFSHFGLRSIHCPRFKNADVIGVGSILHMLPSDYKGYILGSGLINPASARIFPKATIPLVRGHLTRQLCSLPEHISVGDPGLIADTIYKKNLSVNKSWDIGVIPHYRDWADTRLNKLLKYDQDSIHLIDVKRKPREVIHDISKCRYIVSSSLHGLVIADSLGIPNSWIKVSEKLIGGSFKFDDYYSCFGVKRTPTDIQQVDDFLQFKETASSLPMSLLEETKANILESFQAFCSNSQKK